MVHVVLTKQPINLFEPVQQGRQRVQTAYCPNIYIVKLGGLELEEEYVYDGQDDQCSFNKSLVKVQVNLNCVLIYCRYVHRYM